jgi:hypothetical protein
MKRLFAVLMVLVLTACASAPAAPVAGTLKTVRIGYVPVLIYAPLYVGIERGYFAAEGIKIESTPIQGGVMRWYNLPLVISMQHLVAQGLGCSMRQPAVSSFRLWLLCTVKNRLSLVHW